MTLSGVWLQKKETGFKKKLKLNSKNKFLISLINLKMQLILKSFKKQHPRRQERLLDSEVVPAKNYTAERVVVREHFQIQSEGTSTTLADILRAERKQAVATAVRNASIVKTVEAIPTTQ